MKTDRAVIAEILKRAEIEYTEVGTMIVVPAAMMEHGTTICFGPDGSLQCLTPTDSDDDCISD
ncbi:MAG: hypothetical protein ACRYGG_03155 [Janthinobacterium lividum]